MDMPIGYLGLTKETYNFLYQAGCRTLRDVCAVVDGDRHIDIPNKNLFEAKDSIKIQEDILGVKFLNEK